MLKNYFVFEIQNFAIFQEVVQDFGKPDNYILDTACFHRCVCGFMSHLHKKYLTVSILSPLIRV